MDCPSVVSFTISPSNNCVIASRCAVVIGCPPSLPTYFVPGS